MSKKVLIVLLIISVAINIAAAVMFGRFLWHIHEFRSHGRPHMMGPFGDWERGFIRDKLNLTDEQVEKLNAMQEELQPEIKPLREELHRIGKEMLLTWRESDPDTIRAESLRLHLINVQREMDEHLFTYLKGVHNVLTQEQREKLFDMMEKRPMPPGDGPGP